MNLILGKRDFDMGNHGMRSRTLKSVNVQGGMIKGLEDQEMKNVERKERWKQFWMYLDLKKCVMC